MTFADEVYNAWSASEFDAWDFAKRIAEASRLIFVGNGGSAAISSHMANDFAKNGRMPTLCFNDAASLTCLANDLGYDKVFAHPIHQHGKEGDLLIAISSSGRSANILRAVESAWLRSVEVVTFTGFDDDNPLRQRGSINYYVPSHDYGVVETVHLGMLHAALSETIRARQ